MVDRRDDPAARLHDALTACLERITRQPDNGLGSVLAAALDVDGPTEAMTVLLMLLDETKRRMRSLSSDMDAEAYLLMIAPIAEWLGQLQLRSAGKSQTFDDARALAGLKVCSEQLQRFRPLERMDAEQVDEWRDLVDALLSDVLQAEGIDDGLRRFLLDALAGIGDALADYRLTGGARLSDVIDRTVGRFAAERPQPKNAREKSLLDKVVQVCVALSAVMHVGTQALALPQHIESAYAVLADETDLVSPPRELPPAPSADEPVDPDEDG